MNRHSGLSRPIRTLAFKRASRSPLRSHSRRRGAALLEFALVATMFLTLLLGMLQFGIYLSTTNSLWNLSREGARFASVQRSENDAKNDNNSLITQHIKEPSPKGMLPPNVDSNKLTVTITPADGSKREKGSEVTVALTYDMSDKIFVPLGGLLNKKYTTTTTMMVE